MSKRWALRLEQAHGVRDTFLLSFGEPFPPDSELVCVLDLRHLSRTPGRPEDIRRV